MAEVERKTTCKGTKDLIQNKAHSLKGPNEEFNYTASYTTVALA